MSTSKFFLFTLVLVRVPVYGFNDESILVLKRFVAKEEVEPE